MLIMNVPVFTYLFTPWCRVLPEKLTGLQLVKKFPAFHGTRRFITALTSARHLSLTWASPIQSIYPHPTSWRSILILSAHLRLGLPSGSFSPVSPPRPYTPPLLTHTRHVPSPFHYSTFTESLRKVRTWEKFVRNWSRRICPMCGNFWLKVISQRFPTHRTVLTWLRAISFKSSLKDIILGQLKTSRQLRRGLWITSQVKTSSTAIKSDSKAGIVVFDHKEPILRGINCNCTYVQ